MSNPNNINNLSERAKDALFEQIRVAEELGGTIGTSELEDSAVTAVKLATPLDLASHALTSLSIENGTPVNAVAASGIFTMTGVITPGSHGETVLTSNTTDVGNTETVTIDATVYRFMDTMAQAYDIQRGVSAADSLDNLKAAINLTGTPGTEYYAGTAAHPTVVATTNTDTTQKIVVRIPGTASNAAPTEDTSATYSWADTTLGGGTGTSTAGVIVESVTIDARVYNFVDVLSETNAPAAAVTEQVLFGADTAAALDNLKLAINNGATEGTNYSTGTAVHATVTATTNTNTEQTVAAKTSGTSENTLATTDVTANGSWAAATLQSGIDGTVGIINEILGNTSYLYFAIAANTVADANWRRITLGSAY